MTQEFEVHESVNAIPAVLMSQRGTGLMVLEFTQDPVILTATLTVKVAFSLAGKRIYSILTDNPEPICGTNDVKAILNHVIQIRIDQNRSVARFHCYSVDRVFASSGCSITKG